MSAREKGAWRAPALGEARALDLPQGKLRYHEAGTGSPIVFVHGLLVNANLWRKVIAQLGADFRCIALDLPLGSHTTADARRRPLAARPRRPDRRRRSRRSSLEDVTLVGNDTGGALCQMVVTRRPERIGRLVLTSCDYRDNFPPPMFGPLLLAARMPGGLAALLAPMRLTAPRRLPIAFGWLVKRPIDRPAEDSYVYPSMIDADVRGRHAAVPEGHRHARHERGGRPARRASSKPALIAWSREDRFFKPADAEALARELPARGWSGSTTPARSRPRTTPSAWRS